MLARLQKFTTIGLLALALLWAVWAWRAGHPRWAFGGALLIVFGYALVLAVEFALLRAVHGDDPAPRATLAQLFRAWCGEVVSAPLVFCWRQPFRSRRWPDLVSASLQARRGVVLVHGFVCNRGVWNDWLERLSERGQPFIAINLDSIFGSIDDHADCIDAAVQRLTRATGLAPVIVAHSMGGLAVRHWWSEHPDAPVPHVITIGTPHHGAWIARFAISVNGRQMQRQSPWLKALGEREPPGRARRFTCFYSHCDNIVFPPSTATLAGAENRHLTGVAHVHMVSRPEPWQETLRWLS